MYRWSQHLQRDTKPPEETQPYTISRETTKENNCLRGRKISLQLIHFRIESTISPMCRPPQLASKCPLSPSVDKLKTTYNWNKGLKCTPKALSEHTNTVSSSRASTWDNKTSMISNHWWHTVYDGFHCYLCMGLCVSGWRQQHQCLPINYTESKYILLTPPIVSILYNCVLLAIQQFNIDTIPVQMWPVENSHFYQGLMKHTPSTLSIKGDTHI